jgi:hypothetical protein
MPLILNGTDSSATTPALQGGTGGTTTGQYFPAINVWGVSTNSTERMRIDSSGNVGIGTASPGEQLHVSGNIRMSAVAGTNTNAALPVLFQTSTGTIEGGSGLTYNPGGDALGVNGMSITASSVSGAGSSATFTCANGAGQYDFVATSDSLRFTAGSSERMRITTAGFVGIGVAAPLSKLDILLTGTASIATTTITKVTDFAASSSFGFPGLPNNNDGAYFGMGAGGSNGIPAGLGFMRQAAGWQTAIAFYTNNVTGGANGTNAIQEKMRIDADGNLGIGTSSPGYKLVIKQSSGDTQFAMQGAVKNWNFRNQADGTFGLYDDSLGYWRYMYDASNNHIWYNSTGTERMRITSAGLVGIGTSTPSEQLTLASGYVQTGNGIGGAGGVLFPYGGDAGTRTWRVRTDHAAYGDWGVEQSTTRTGTNFATKLLIDPNGNVGIGTSSPVAKLAVVGGTTNASNLATAYSSASFNINPKSTSGYSLQFGSGPSDLPYIQQSAGGGSAGDMTIQPYGGRLIVGTTTNTYNGHTLQYDPGAGNWALAVINSKTDNSTATDGLLVKYSGVTPNDGYQMFLCQDGSNVNRFYVLNNGATGGTSDGRLKKNITTARDGYLEDLGKIRIVKYNWNEQPEGTPKELGWIAQEVEQVFPQMISTDAETGYKSVKYSVFVPLLIKAVQELKAIVDAQTVEINTLKSIKTTLT